MRCLPVALVLLAATVQGAASLEGWTTYRSEEFGWELSYPPDIELKVWLGGRSGELRVAATGDELAELELWPGDLCPREKPGTTAKAIGMERVAAVTQADGDGSSSSCLTPIAIRRLASDHAVPLYELRLACASERTVRRRTVRRREGIKGPTFFADVSQSWRKRVLTVDPAGVDPRMGPSTKRADLDTLRRILATLATFPLPEPKVLCIEDAPGSRGNDRGADVAEVRARP
jgi:hypothetical protein